MTMPLTIEAALSAGRTALEGAGVETSALDARLLLEAAMDAGTARIVAEPDQALDTGQEEQYRWFLERRRNREPISQILGRRAFWKDEFVVTADTLTPKARFGNADRAGRRTLPPRRTPPHPGSRHRHRMPAPVGPAGISRCRRRGRRPEPGGVPSGASKRTDIGPGRPHADHLRQLGYGDRRDLRSRSLQSPLRRRPGAGEVAAGGHGIRTPSGAIRRCAGPGCIPGTHSRTGRQSCAGGRPDRRDRTRARPRRQSNSGGIRVLRGGPCP